MASGTVQREQERKIADLNRQNFDLKMQVYHLNQRLNELRDESKSAPESDRIDDISYADKVPILEQNRLLQKKLDEIEKVVKQLRLENASLTSEIKKPQTTKDIQAAIAIAENDTVVINRLENEVNQLKAEHLNDVRINNEYLDRIDSQRQSIDDLQNRLAKERGISVRMQQKISLLLDRIKRNELIIRKHNIKLPADENFAVDDLIGVVITDSVDPTTPDVATQSHIKSAIEINGKNSKKSVSPQDFLDFGSRSAWGELHYLRKQLKEVRQQLHSERELFKAQEEALKLLQQSVLDVGRMESNEIRRLEAELDKCVEISEKWKKRFQELQKTSNDKINSNSEVGFSEDIDNWDGSPGESAELRLSAAVVHARSKQNHSTTISLADHNRILELYRIREAELLQVLEQVLFKCQSLENQTV